MSAGLRIMLDRADFFSMLQKIFRASYHGGCNATRDYRLYGAREGPEDMRTIILSAGQGKRLLPLTAERPKCLVPICGRPMIAWQIDALLACGVEDICVVLGYGADTVEHFLEEQYGRRFIRTLFNPFFSVSDNLATCWIARGEMTADFILLNGDTLFRPAVVEKLLDVEPRPITVTVDRKNQYDVDDMKVILDGERLVRIGKDLPLEQVHAESIGMLLLRDQGPELFRHGVEQAMRRPAGLKRWYLSVIDELAQQGLVWTCCIEGLAWGEVDSAEDLERAAYVVRGIATWDKGVRCGMAL